MPDSYDRAAFLERFHAAMKPHHDRIAAVHSCAPFPPEEAASLPFPTPLALPVPRHVPTAADLEFDRVRTAALVRIEAERAARRAEDAAVAMILDTSGMGPSRMTPASAREDAIAALPTADPGEAVAGMILDAYRAFEPTPAVPERGSRHDQDDEDAAAAILEMLPLKLRK